MICTFYPQKKEKVSKDCENPIQLPNPVVKSSRRPLRNLKNSQKDKSTEETSKPPIKKKIEALTKVRKMLCNY